MAETADGGSYIDWQKLAWNLNGSDASVVFDPDTQISTAVLNDDNTITIVLNTVGRDALYEATGFAASGGNDDVTITNGFTSDYNGNIATSDGSESVSISFTDGTDPTTLVRIYSNEANTSRKAGDEVTIYAEFNEELAPGSYVDAVLSTGESVRLLASTGDEDPSDLLVGTYTVYSDVNDGIIGESDFTDTTGTAGLDVNSIDASNLTDVYGNSVGDFTSFTAAQKLSTNSPIEIDITAPQTTISSASFENGVITLTGAGFNLAQLGRNVSPSDAH